MPHSAKLIAYRLCKGLGLFALARWATRRELRILAYHGFATADEAQFRSKLFIHADSFRRRLQILARDRYPVVPLGRAMDDLAAGRLRPGTVVITIDDGYVSTLTVAAPLLQQHRFPALVYLTSYHMASQTPVFDLMVGYLVWKARAQRVSLSGDPWPAPLTLELDGTASRNAAQDRLLDIGHAMDSESGRVALCAALARALDVEAAAGPAAEAFRLMSPAEARQLPARGIEIGLHTHRHRFPPDDMAACQREIDDNRRYLEREVGPATAHFCYPSGDWDQAHLDLLARCGVSTATTCDTGLVRSTDSPFALRRFLDGEGVSDLEFEAEVSGFADCLRRLLRVERSGASGV